MKKFTHEKDQEGRKMEYMARIKAVLDHQLVNLRTYNLDPRAPAQDCRAHMVTIRTR